MGRGNGSGDFMVEEPDPAIYNPTSANPPLWQPRPDEILSMFQQLDRDKVLPLKWICPGRRPPERELPAHQAMDFPSDGDEEEEDRGEERRNRVPEPSEFDFDDLASEASTKITPRTPVSAKSKQPKKRMASMSSVLSSLRRQQKAEREARKNQGRIMGPSSSFRSSTMPSRPNNFSTANTPISSRLGGPTGSPYGVGSPVSWSSATPSGSPSGSPSVTRIGAPVGPPSAWSAGSPMPSQVMGPTGSPSAARNGGPIGMPTVSRQTGSPSFARGAGGNMHTPSSPMTAGSPAIPPSVSMSPVSQQSVNVFTGSSAMPITVSVEGSSSLEIKSEPLPLNADSVAT